MGRIDWGGEGKGEVGRPGNATGMTLERTGPGIGVVAWRQSEVIGFQVSFEGGINRSCEGPKVGRIKVSFWTSEWERELVWKGEEELSFQLVEISVKISSGFG